jgi:hypothetical protein
MFDKTIVEDTLVGIVGVEQPNNPDYAIIDIANLASTSGYFVTEFPLVKIEFFKEAQDYIDITDADFNDLLRTTQKSAITSVCNQVFQTEDFIDRGLFYKNATNNVDAETLTDGFVNWEINVTKEKNIAFEITRVILDFESNFPNDIILQLYNTGDPNPIQSKTINITEKHQEEVLNWAVDNSGDTYKGDYYLGYIKSATTPVPYKRNYHNANIISKIDGLTIQSMQVTGHTGNEIFDLNDTEGLSENIGVNPDVIVYNDYTDFIKQNRRLFGRAIQLDMAIKMINVSAYSIRVNKDERISDSLQVKMFQAVNGVDAAEGRLKVKGLNEKLIGELTMIKTEVEKLRHGYFGGRVMVYTRT